MSRFAALDLSALPDPAAIGVLDFKAILEARLVELEAQLAEVFDAPKVAEVMALARNIASSPMRYLNEAAAARELYLENRINEAVRSVFLSTARGDDLDQIGANRGVVRKVLDDSDPESPVMEGDEAFRARIQLVIEAWSPHGTEGSYVYWALDADDRVADVAVYGPNHGLDPAIPPAEPKMVILSSEGDGTADAPLLDAVFAHCTVDKRRPVADKLTVVSAQPVPYAIEAILHVTTPETASAVQATAQAAAEAFVNSRIRIGRKLYRTSLAAALTVKGVVDVELVSPAADLEIGPFEAPYCTGITLTLQSITGGGAMFDVKDTLLPPTATPLAKALDILEERLFHLPVEMISKNPQTVDTRLLDHLAWEESVDVWDFDWPDDVKRNVIAASAEVHRFKGTPHAIKLALEAFDVDTELLEWFEPEGVQDGLEPGSFRVTAYAGRSLYGDSENTLNNRMVAAMNAVLQRVAPVSRKLVFRLGEKFQTATYVRGRAGQSQRQDGATDVDPRPEVSSPILAVRAANRAAQRAGGEIDVLPPEVAAATAVVTRTETVAAGRNSWLANPDPRDTQSSVGLTLQPAARAVALSSEFHDIQRRA